MNRRVFVRSGALSFVTLGLAPTFLKRSAFAGELLKGAATHGNARGKVLICLFQRGAADALNMIVPHGDPFYYKLRQGVARPRAGSRAAAAGGAPGGVV